MFRYRVILADEAGKKTEYICYGDSVQEAEAMAMDMAKHDHIHQPILDRSYREMMSFA